MDRQKLRSKQPQKENIRQQQRRLLNGKTGEEPDYFSEIQKGKDI